MEYLVRNSKPYTCPACHQDMLFFTNHRMRNLIDYKEIYDNDNLTKLKNIISNNNYKYLKCAVCKKIFILDWRHRFPRAMYDNTVLPKFGINTGGYIDD